MPDPFHTMRFMSSEEHLHSETSRPNAVHAERDSEELDRLRQLGGIVVHDLNNALFALLGRTQLLQRKAAGTEFARDVVAVQDTVRLLEALISKLNIACQRDETADERSNLRAAVLLGLRAALGTLPDSLQPVSRDRFNSWLHETLESLPRDAFVAGSIRQVSTAIAQIVSIHRARAAKPIMVSCSVRDDRGDLYFDFIAEDDGGPWEYGVEAPSLLHGSFELALLPLATARRATRDFGGTVALERSPRGLRSHLSFRVERGLHLEQSHSSHAQRSAACTTTSPADSAPVKQRRVLVADDDATLRALLIAALESVGDEVDVIANPAILDAQPNLESYDVVILDAGGGGLQALARLRGGGSRLPVLVASGDMVEGSFDECTRVLMKPIMLDRLDRELTQLASRRPR
jgi:CheY-like chemotaxis protein